MKILEESMIDRTRTRLFSEASVDVLTLVSDLQSPNSLVG